MTQNELEAALLLIGAGAIGGSWLTLLTQVALRRWRSTHPTAARPPAPLPLPQVPSVDDRLELLDRRLEELEERTRFDERLLETVAR